MRERIIARWQGILLSLVGIVATGWLAATGQLGLYIHPRYFEFTVVMAVIASVLTFAAFAVAPLPDGHEHPEHHEHSEHPDPEHRRGGGIRAILGAAVVVAAAIALLALPPATLTSATATQRSINSSAVSAGTDSPDLVGGDTSQFTVKDWAVLLRQNPDPDFFAGRSIEATGFVTASPDDPENVFYIARFTVTCCAVDAQPVGVPVHLPGWRERFEPDQWVTATGLFEANVGTTSAETLLLTPDDIAVTAQPDQPYVF